MRLESDAAAALRCARQPLLDFNDPVGERRRDRVGAAAFDRGVGIFVFHGLALAGGARPDSASGKTD